MKVKKREKKRKKKRKKKEKKMKKKTLPDFNSLHPYKGKRIR